MDADVGTNVSPEQFFTRVREGIVIRETRWVPLSWSQEDGHPSSSRTVTRWLWVCLAEVADRNLGEAK